MKRECNLFAGLFIDIKKNNKLEMWIGNRYRRQLTLIFFSRFTSQIPAYEIFLLVYQTARCVFSKLTCVHFEPFGMFLSANIV